MEFAENKKAGWVATLWSSVLGSLALILGLGVTHNAQAAGWAENGCTRLAEIVEQSVAQNLRPGALYRSGPDTLQPARVPLTACATTAATASAAFSRAMRAMGVTVFWNESRQLEPGDYCLSHFLDQCYPRTSPGIFNNASFDAAIVTTAWKTIATGIRHGMPFGAASDIAIFRPSQLADGLGFSLQVTLPLVRADGSHVTGTAAWPE